MAASPFTSVVLIACLVLHVSARRCTIHVRPVAPSTETAVVDGTVVHSLAEAAGQVAKHLAGGARSDVTVCLGSGIHNGCSWRLDETHSPQHPNVRVRWVGSGDVTAPSVVSGGVQLNQWTAGPNGTLQAQVPASLHGQAIRQLWVSGVRYNRTQDQGFVLKPVATGYIASSEPNWVVPSTVEFLWPSQIRNWVQPRCVVSAAHGTNISMTEPCWSHVISRNGGKLPAAPKIIENVGLPTAPGEWYYNQNTGIVYLKPLSDHKNGTDAWVPVNDTLLEAHNISSHSFSNIIFEYGTWHGASSPNGFVGLQTAVYMCSDPYCPTQPTETRGLSSELSYSRPGDSPHRVEGSADAEPQGSIMFHSVSGVQVSNCSFQHLGGLYALSFGAASQDISVTNNVFTDLSGGFLKIGNVLSGRAVTNDTRQWDSHYDVSNNVASHSSLEFTEAAALFAGYMAYTNITQNTIQHTGYTGISLGWGWGRVKSFARYNHITGNDVGDVMRSLVDGGCIYTLGPQLGSTVSGNYVHDDHEEFGVIYHDNGSRYFVDSNNVISNNAAHAFFLQGCCNSPAYDIHVSSTYIKNSQVYWNHCAPQGCTVNSSSIYQVGATQPWPPAAAAIIAQAGAQA